MQAAIFAWPDAAGNGRRGAPDDRQQALLTATDEFIMDRSISDATWQQLAEHLDRRQLIEFCLLASAIRRSGRDDVGPGHPAGQPGLDASQR